MGGAAPGDGEPLTGAAALSTNGSVQGRGSDQSGAEGRAGLGSTWRPEFSPSAAVGETVSVPGSAAAAVALVSWSRWGQKRKPGGNSCLSSQRWSCVSSQSSGGTIGRVGGWRKVRPTPLARGTGGVEKPASFTLLVLRPRRRSRFPAAWGVASSPPPHR